MCENKSSEFDSYNESEIRALLETAISFTLDQDSVQTGRLLANRYTRIESRYSEPNVRKWVVVDGGIVLNKLGEMEYEPLPSNRSDAFIKRTRFDTVAEAKAAWDKFCAEYDKEKKDN